MNTRKDFKKAASMIKYSTMPGTDERRMLTQVFSAFFASDNPRFNETKFIDAIED